MSSGRRRVAILGGGQSALTAALQLTDPKNPSAGETDVTIYQLGWRLGGKGATGRPTVGPPRVMEHGLHEWFGFYVNSFAQIRDVYKELNRPPGAPLATCGQALQGTDTGFLVEFCEGKPLLWETTYETKPGSPSHGTNRFDPLEYIAQAIESHERKLADSSLAGLPGKDAALRARLRAVFRGVETASASAARAVLRAASVLARGGANGLPAWLAKLESVVLWAVAGLLWVFLRLLWCAVRRDITTIARTKERRLWIEANFSCACVIGAIRDRVVADGFDVINELDFREWLRRHHYPDGDVMLGSPVVEAVYQGCFAYPRGIETATPHPGTENMEAGTALRGIVRTLFGYQGSLVYRFTAGTADSAYAPIYQVLRARSVTIRFFSRVERLELGADGRVARVHVAEQAQVKGDVPYDPLFDVHGLPCWPLEPQWDQLVDGAALQAEDAQFEWPSDALRARERPLVLEDGRDYDDVVLGISIAALPPICGDLVARYPAWERAFSRIETVRTQSLQLWLTENAVQLGFPVATPQLTPWRYSASSPLDVWGDFSKLLPWEFWPQGLQPASLAYFTGPMLDEKEFPDQATADGQTRNASLAMLRYGLPVILPKVLDGEGEFRWELLVVPDASAPIGVERLDTQWIRANVLPSERYVLSVAGTSKYRLPVHDAAGPANLYLAGDWTQNTLNCGCMEAATISGMLCSNALSGYPARDAIVGVDF